MEDVALSTLKTNVSSAGLALAKSAIDALGKLPDSDRAIMLFDNNSTASSKHGNFQVIVCDQNASGELSAVFGMFFFYGPKHDPRFLWDAVSSQDVWMQAQRNAYVLDEDIYARLRKQITKKLGDTVNTLVAAINVVEYNAFVV
mmetsp:Transcript_85643/g.151136  ORF Transcript_85643/g.151136 Transcript_85643/m.151136 type:complete len:144 (-) Transcript_85643:387-818(-)